VALKATFRGLFSELRKLHDMLIALRLTVAEDKPHKGDAALVDHLGDSILDLMGLLDGCLKSARAAQKAVGHPIDMDGARRAVTTCQEGFHKIEHQFAAELVSYEKLRDLANLRERGTEWRLWSNTVKQGIEQCRAPLDSASKALAACWQEIAERVGMTSVSVQTTNIGQKIVAKASDLSEMARSGLT
jgi:hypothetical protein